MVSWEYHGRVICEVNVNLSCPNKTKQSTPASILSELQTFVKLDMQLYVYHAVLFEYTVTSSQLFGVYITTPLKLSFVCNSCVIQRLLFSWYSTMQEKKSTCLLLSLCLNFISCITMAVSEMTSFIFFYCTFLYIILVCVLSQKRKMKKGKENWDLLVF